ncbi:trypsin-like peptidase domain-containing protein [Schlesneria sp. T3-172]|uniref:trypsin-like peptidase domain-containing protein n=1 Tax=Schlesneria sphaerica TaxID=3373610 RepID=UPI0037CC507C
MTTKIRCTECDTSLRVGEKHYGRSVKCPRCGATVKVPQPEFAEGEDFALDDQELSDFEEQPRRKSTRSANRLPSKSARRGKKPNKQSSNHLPAIVGAAAIAGLLIVGGIYWTTRRGGDAGTVNPGQVTAIVPPVPAGVGAAPAGAAQMTTNSGPLGAATTTGAMNQPQLVPGGTHSSGPGVGSAPTGVQHAVAGTAPPLSGGASPEAINAVVTSPQAHGVAPAGNLDLSVLTDRAGRGLVLLRIKDNNGQNLGLGSGFLISRDGLVATNFHVMKEGATAEAEFRDGVRVPVSGYRAFDSKRDIAIVQLESVPPDAVPLELAPSLDVQQGASVVAMGHPRGLRFTATEGIVSAIHKTSDLPADLRRQMECPDDQIWIQTSATIFSGNSGGPLLSRSGKVIGINSWITRDVDFGFALAIQHLIELTSQVKDSVLSLAEVNRQGRADDTVFSLGDLDPKVKVIQDEYQRSFEEFEVRLKTAQTAEEVQKIITSNNPARRDVPRLIKIASENPKTPAAYQALVLSLAMLRQYFPESTATSPMQQVTTQLLRDHLDEKSIVTAVVLAGTFELASTKAFLSEVINRSTDKDVQGIACLFLAKSLIASDKSAPKKEGVRLLERIVNEFSEVMIRDVPIVEDAQRMLFAELHLSIGAEAPEIIGRDAEGNEFKLSDYRGKVVMLDFFADWCPHCTKMYPLERIMVEKQRDRPYILLGVNCDRDGVLQKLIEEKKVTWKCWADGEDGPIATEWQLSGFPMIILIDHQGIIRYQFNGAPDPEVVDRALAQLVGKVGSGKTNSNSKKPISGSRAKGRSSSNP